MKVSILSDTHFGDPDCTLITKDQKGRYRSGERYEAFFNQVGPDNDYLLLVGDILDFSVVSYQEAYQAGQAFFKQIQTDGITKEIIYVPGNHDADIWHVVEHEVNVIDQLRKARPPREFHWSLPGILDFRGSSANKTLVLPGVRVNTAENEPKYAGLFLDTITGKDTPTTFNFVYPNVYLVTDDETVLITHGHYLEFYWSLLSEWTLNVFGPDLRIGDMLDLKELIGINFPLNQLACSGVGQAGPLTPVLNNIQFSVRNGQLTLITKYLNRLDDQLDESVFDYGWYDPREAASDLICNVLKASFLKNLGDFHNARYSEEFIHRPEVLQRFRTFYKASCAEIQGLNSEHGYNIPPPTSVIFGHTHQPIPWKCPNAPKTEGLNGMPVRLYNTGGWLNRKNNDGMPKFCGAEVFVYETGKGMRSSSIE